MQIKQNKTHYSSEFSCVFNLTRKRTKYFKIQVKLNKNALLIFPFRCHFFGLLRYSFHVLFHISLFKSLGFLLLILKSQHLRSRTLYNLHSFLDLNNGRKCAYFSRNYEDFLAFCMLAYSLTDWYEIKRWFGFDGKHW